MISIASETLLSLAQARAWLSARGVQRSPASIYRWVEAGRLETVEIGGIRHTSVEALQRMAEGERPEANRPRQKRRKRTDNPRGHEEAMAELRRMGVVPAGGR